MPPGPLPPQLTLRRQQVSQPEQYHQALRVLGKPSVAYIAVHEQPLQFQERMLPRSESGAGSWPSPMPLPSQLSPLLALRFQAGKEPALIKTGVGWAIQPHHRSASSISALLCRTGADLLRRFLETVRYSRLRERLIHHHADGHLPRLSIPGSEAKRKGLRYFYRKCRGRMSGDQEAAFVDRSRTLFGCAPTVPEEPLGYEGVVSGRCRHRFHAGSGSMRHHLARREPGGRSHVFPAGKGLRQGQRGAEGDSAGERRAGQERQESLASRGGAGRNGRPGRGPQVAGAAGGGVCAAGRR